MLTEVIGYIARIAIHSNPFLKTNFLMYLVTLTIAPAFLSASIYLCLARIVVVYGEEASRFKPRTYTVVFCTGDFLALLLQAVGGAIASDATSTSAVSIVPRAFMIYAY
jgi:RTA1 like protein